MLNPTVLMWMCYDMPHGPLNCARTMPMLPGVYIVYQGEEVLYVGKTQNLQQRWKAHHRRYQLTMFGEGVEIAWHAMPGSDPETRTQHEQSLITTFHPRLNKQTPVLNTTVPSPHKNHSSGVNAIRAIRESQHKTRKDLAAFLNKSELTVWRYEENRSDISAFALQDMARFLGVSVLDLLTRTGSAIQRPSTLTTPHTP